MTAIKLYTWLFLLDTENFQAKVKEKQKLHEEISGTFWTFVNISGY